MKKLTIILLCSLVFIVSWKSEKTGASSAETSAAQTEDEYSGTDCLEDFSGENLQLCIESGSGEVVQSDETSSESSWESGDSSGSVEGSGHHEEGSQNVETLHASSDHVSSSDHKDSIFLEDLEVLSESEISSPIIEEIEMSGHNASSGAFDDDDEDL